LAQLIYATAALADLERLVDFLIDAEPVVAVGTIDLISEAIDVLANHPLIGRPAEKGLRELVISRGHSGYVALYSYEQLEDTVLVLALRHQREAGYSDEASP
jgi:plasmid stabilization system protein ParE